MILRSCSGVRRRLAAYCDGELSVDDQIQIQNHLRECPACAREVRELATVGEALRDAAAVVVSSRTAEDLDGLAAGVVSRMSAERDESLGRRFGRMFEDLHLVWAALGATGATIACVLLMIGIFYFATHERPDSLSAVLTAMAAPAGSNANPVSLDDRMRLPRAYDDGVLPTTLDGEEDAVFALAAVVTQEGRVANLELLLASEHAGKRSAGVSREEILDLLDTISRARFEPARFRGAPIAVNMVWLLAHLTVRAKLPETVTEPRSSPGRAISQHMVGYHHVAV